MRLDARSQATSGGDGKHENKRKIYCTNVHLRIIEILITLMYNLSAVTAAVTLPLRKHTPVCQAGSSEVKETAKVTKNRLIYDKMRKIELN